MQQYALVSRESYIQTRRIRRDGLFALLRCVSLLLLVNAANACLVRNDLTSAKRRNLPSNFKCASFPSRRLGFIAFQANGGTSKQGRKTEEVIVDSDVYMASSTLSEEAPAGRDLAPSPPVKKAAKEESKSPPAKSFSRAVTTGTAQSQEDLGREITGKLFDRL